MKKMVMNYLEGLYDFVSAPRGEKIFRVATHTHNEFRSSCLRMLIGMILFMAVSRFLVAQASFPESEGDIYKAIYLPGADKEATPPLKSPVGFTARSDDIIINDLK